jgi:hypothetical protein
MKLKQNFKLWPTVVLLLVAMSPASRAQFGGSSIVFDPQMFARQLLQLQQETAAVTNLAQQLQYMVKNTTGGGAGVWQSNQNLLSNLGGLISEQQGLSYTFQGLAQQFKQLYPGYNVTNTPGVQSPQASVDTTLNTLNEVAIIQSFCGFLVLFAFTITAIALLFTLVEAYIAVSGGIILLGFGGSRFTASASEGYFPFVIRVGVRLLFFYLVLAVGVQLANQWATAILAACKPVTAAVPMISSYFVPPSKIMTTMCSGFIPTSAMLNYAALALVFAAMTIGIPTR